MYVCIMWLGRFFPLQNEIVFRDIKYIFLKLKNHSCICFGCKNAHCVLEKQNIQYCRRLGKHSADVHLLNRSQREVSGVSTAITLEGS